MLVVLSGPGHLRELRDLIAATLQITTREPPLGEQLGLDDGQDLLASRGSPRSPGTTSPASCASPDLGLIDDYVRSVISAQNQHDPWALAAAVVSRLPPATDRFASTPTPDAWSEHDQPARPA